MPSIYHYHSLHVEVTLFYYIYINYVKMNFRQSVAEEKCKLEEKEKEKEGCYCVLNSGLSHKNQPKTTAQFFFINLPFLERF